MLSQLNWIGSGRFMHETSVLDNQLRVITQHVPGANSVAIGILVDAGPQDEPENKRGIAHLTEHALFLGTSGRSTNDISRMIDEAGGQLGAFTTRDYTCFSAHIMDDYCPFALDLFGDVLLNSTFPEESLAREREVVLQELGICSEDKSKNLHDMLKRAIWPKHPLGREVAGDIESVRDLTREDVIYFVGQNYVPDRMIVVAVGNIDHQQAVAQAEDAFWRLLGSSNPREPKPCEFHSAIEVATSAISHSYFALALPSLAYNAPERYSVHALNSIVGGGMSSRLYTRLRESLGLVYDIHSSYCAYRDAGSMVVEGIAYPETLTKILSIVTEEIEKIANDGICEDEIWRTKLQIRGQHQLASDSMHTRMSRVLTQQFYLGKPQKDSEVLQGLSEVTRESVQAEAQRMLASQDFGLAVVGPEESEFSEQQLRDSICSACELNVT